MKTGRPEYYIPSPTTVSRDVKQVFANVRKRIGKMLQEHDGKLSFATDAWTSPNHKAFVAVTVHFEINGVPMTMLLDMKEVATSHSGLNLAAAFAQILDEFGISTKVSDCSI
jgi:coproporphyrinogen III oxidase